MKRKRVIAVLAMILLILLAVPIGLYSSVASLRDDALAVYHDDQTGYTILRGLQNRADAAENLLKIAEKYQDQHGELEIAVAQLEDTVGALDEARSGAVDEAQARANQALDASAQTLAEALLALDDIAEADQTHVDNQLQELRSNQEQINHSDYNEAAVDFNQGLEEYPAKLLADIGLVKRLPDYRN